MKPNNENQNHPELDDRLNAAVWAVVSEPVPADAVARVKQRAVEVTGDRQPVVSADKSHRRFSTTQRLFLAACVIAIVAVGLGLFNIPFGYNNVYAQVAERLGEVKSLVCYVHFSESGIPDDQQDLVGLQKATYLAPSFHRIEDERLGTVQIVDREQNRTVLLVQGAKQAIVVDGLAAVSMNADSPAKLVEALMRHISVDRVGDDTIKSLGTRIVDRVELQGYESTIGGETIRAWFDTETLAPAMVAVRFEIPAHMADGNAVPMWRVMSDIKVDVGVSRDQFTTDVPSGYETLSVGIPQQQAPAALEDVIEMLRRCAGANDNEFPLWLSINDEAGTPLSIQNEFVETLEEEFNEGDDARKASTLALVQDFGSAVGRAMAFQFSIKPENDWNYFGGAKLNDAERPILWFSPGADDDYKVVYADLTVKDVARDNLPPKPKPLVRQATRRNLIRVATPRFKLPQNAVRDYATLQQIRKAGTQADVEYLSLAWMPEFVESQVEPKLTKADPGETISADDVVMQEVDPKWKPNRQAESSRLAFLQEFTKLKGLDVSHLYLTQADLETIAGCKKLQRLSLSGVRIFDSSSRRLTGDDLAKLSNLKSLELLDLSQSNFIGGLKHLKKLPRLHTLYLSSFEHLNDASVAELSVLPHLETLLLAPVYMTNPKTTVTEAGLKSLKNLPRLRKLYVGYHGKWTLPIDRLRELMPDVDVRSPTEGVAQ